MSTVRRGRVSRRRSATSRASETAAWGGGGSGTEKPRSPTAGMEMADDSSDRARGKVTQASRNLGQILSLSLNLNFCLPEAMETGPRSLR